MKTHYVTVVLDRNMAEKIPTTVYPHEVEILKLIHKDAVSDAPEVEWPEPVELDLDEEYGRLLTKYGTDADRNIPFVEIIYGHRNAHGIKKFYAGIDKESGKKATGKAE